MKVAIESSDGGKTISAPFIRSHGYLVFEVEKDRVIKSEFYENDIQPVEDCSAIISRGMPRELKSQLERKGKKVLITFSSSPKQALHHFLINEFTDQMMH